MLCRAVPRPIAAILVAQQLALVILWSLILDLSLSVHKFVREETESIVEYQARRAVQDLEDMTVSEILDPRMSVKRP